MRETLTALDVLADVGGFAEVLAFGSSLILQFFNYQFMNSLLATKLYKEANQDDPSNPRNLDLPRTGYSHEFFIDNL